MNEEFTPLPSAMQMVEAGNQDSEIKRMARAQRRVLRAAVVEEQAFSLLWDRFGNGDDDRDLVWRWRWAFTWIDAGLRTFPQSKWTPDLMADDFDGFPLPDDEQD